MECWAWRSWGPHRIVLLPAAVLRLYRNRVMSISSPSTILTGSCETLYLVMAGLVPAIDDQPELWIRGSSPRMTNKNPWTCSAVRSLKVRARQDRMHQLKTKAVLELT